MKKHIKKHLNFHTSNNLKRLISNVNWHKEKFRIEEYLKKLIQDHNLESEFFVYKKFDGYHGKSFVETPCSGYAEVESITYGHETIGISQRNKETDILEKVKHRDYTEIKIHWDYGINFQIVNSAYGNTIFIISRPKSDDSCINNAEILIGYSRNTAYLCDKKLDKLFKTILFYERMTCFHRQKSITSTIYLKYLIVKSAILRKEISNTDSFSIMNISMLIIAILGLICTYLAIPATNA